MRQMEEMVTVIMTRFELGLQVGRTKKGGGNSNSGRGDSDAWRREERVKRVEVP